MLLGRILRIVARLYSLRLGLGGRCRFLLPARLLLVLDPRLRLLRLLRLGLLTLRALPPLVPAVGGNHAVVMFGVLEEIFLRRSGSPPRARLAPRPGISR